MTLMGRSRCITTCKEILLFHVWHLYLSPADERRKRLGKSRESHFLAHFFLSSLNHHAIILRFFILFNFFSRLKEWLLTEKIQEKETMALTLQRKCDPALIADRCCWETCCRPLEWNLLVGWSHSVADDSSNGHMHISCVRWQWLQRQNADLKQLQESWLTQAVKSATLRCALELIPKFCTTLTPPCTQFKRRGLNQNATATRTVKSYQRQTGVMKVQHAEQQEITSWQQDAEQRQTLERRGRKEEVQGGGMCRSGPAESQWFILKTLVWAPVWVRGCRECLSVWRINNAII